MDFATSSDVSSDDVSVTETKRNSKTIDARAFDVEDRLESRDALLTEFGKDTLQRPLSAARRDLPGSVRPRRLGLCRRPGPCPARL